MAPNGLIFLVVVAIWGAYFVQYWIRRREHLSTARSMDRFSQSLRVLARRSPLPESSLETPSPRAYAVHTARSARPQVLVKRATVTTLTMQVDDAKSFSGSGSFAGAASFDPAAVQRSGRPATRSAGTSTATAVVAGVPRALRGVVILVQLIALPVLLVMAAYSAVSWWAPPLAVAGLACALVWSRSLLRAEAAQRTADRREAQARTSGPTPSQPSHPSHGGRGTLRATRAAARDSHEAADPTVSEGPIRQVVQTPVVDAPFDVDPPREVAAHATPLVDDDDIPLTWDPRPVPRPTYTMKARADHALPPPADVSARAGEATARGGHAAYADDEPAQRAAGA